MDPVPEKDLSYKNIKTKNTFEINNSFKAILFLVLLLHIVVLHDFKALLMFALSRISVQSLSENIIFQ